MEHPKTTAKDFFLWAGAMVSFYWSIIAYTFLVFDYITYAFPNALTYYPADPYQSGISAEMASIIVLFPIYILLMWLIRRGAVVDPSREDIWVRRWALIFTLFVAGIAMAADLITLLTTFLNGSELTTAFLLKVLVILLISTGVFMHFISDLRGYWTRFPKRQNVVRIAVAILAVVTIVAGFFIVGTPGEARLARFDAQKVQDLQNIQSQVISYWQAKQKLPTALTDLSGSLSYGVTPVDPQTGEAYAYQVANALSFKLCANFNAQSREAQGISTMPIATTPDGKTVAQDTWYHTTGRVCYTRTIDPSFYPPLK